jgi:predicted permease
VASARYARTLAPVGGALNRTIFISGQPVKIVGIAPDGFRGTTLTSAPELYMPMRTLATVGRSVINYFGDSTHPSSATSWISVIGRLRPGESVGKATAALGALGPHLATPMPLRAQAASAAALPTKTRDRIAAFARMLGATLGLLIVVAGLALGLLLVIRVEARRAELAMCLALGATKARLAVGVVLEGLGLVAAGVLGSLPICWWLLGSVGAFRLPGDIDIGALSLSVDIEALTAAAALGVFIAGLIAVVAGVLGARAAEARAVQMSPGAMSGHGRRPVRAVLVVAQVAVSSALLLGTALFARSLISALDLNASLAPSRVLSAGLPLGALSYDVPRAERFVADAVEVLARAPEVAGVAVKAELGGMSGTGRLTINGERRPLDGRYVEYVAVDERYFDTLGLSITSGRNFLASDVDGSPLVAIVSESMGRWLAADADPIGVGITETRGRRGQPFAVARVVGVVPDVVKSVGVLEPFTIYFAMSQRGPFTPDRTLVVRAAGDVRTARSSVAAALRSADRSMPQGAILSMRDQVETQMAPQAFAVRVLGALALVAMSLSVLSTFVLASSIARLRMRETAVRAALGAKRIPLGSRLMWQTLRMVVLGLLCGAALAWLGRGLVASFLFQVSPFDPLAVAATGVFVLIVAMAVSLRPALAAANVDLVRLLKDN